MSAIRLVGIVEYARRMGINRSTVWRLLKSDRLDWYVIPGSNKRLIRAKEANFKEKERNAIYQIMNYDIF